MLVNTLINNAVIDLEANIELINGFTYEPSRLVDLSAENYRVRLDWTIANSDGSMTDSDVIHLMMNQLEQDLEDLIENGDKESSDVLLMTLDGNKRRGTDLKSFLITQSYLVIKQVDDSSNYTVYLKFETTW